MNARENHPVNLSRRAALAGLGAAGVVLAQTAAGRIVQSAPQARPSAPDDPTKLLGTPPSERGQRSVFETPSRFTSGVSSRTPLEYLHGAITPSDLHFERHHGGVPTIDPERYELVIHGMVERPMKFTLADLMRFPAVSRLCFLECAGNLWTTAPAASRPGQICGLTSQSEWTGVMLSTLFREVGISDRATWFLAEGSDAAVMTRSIPVAKGWDDAMLAYAQNGEPVRPENGYPVRLLLPGFEGNSNVKWIRRIEAADRPFMTREETSKYTEPLRGGKARQFSFVIDARSIINFPSYPVTLE
jgi:sulfane dehydrogenase subunit SoxC